MQTLIESEMVDAGYGEKGKFSREERKQRKAAEEVERASIAAILSIDFVTNPDHMTGQHQSRYLVYRMLQAMYQRQEVDEQRSHYTRHINGRGFNKIDATILTDIAKRSQAYKNLTPKQAKLVGRLLKKYIGQLVEIVRYNRAMKETAHAS